ncbi:MAG: cation transporter [Syntrophobacteraceae bacterium]
MGDTRRARRLEYLTIGWNLIEAGVALGAGIVAGSIALIGFGVDTLIEILSSLILLWRLLSIHPDERRERIALKLVGVCFLLLAAYVGYEAVSLLVLKKPPERSFPGIAVAILALFVMPLLARAKWRAAGRLNSAALSADSVRVPFAPIFLPYYWEGWPLTLRLAGGGPIRSPPSLCFRSS